MADVVSYVLGGNQEPAAQAVSDMFARREAWLEIMIYGVLPNDKRLDMDEEARINSMKRLNMDEKTRTYLMRNDETHDEEVLLLDSCRYCSDHFQYTWNSWTTKVVVGIPKDESFTAVSYVWGNTSNLPLSCSRCGRVTYMPVESVAKFRYLMRLTQASGRSIWLDALSIDQSDHEDIATQLPRMGEIYEKAWTVSVLLPKSDERAYRLLVYLGEAASYINTSQLAKTRPQCVVEDKVLSLICRIFWLLIEEFEKTVDSFTYWKRAWTFQEWALSHNISLALDGNYYSGTVDNIKFIIIQAATLMSVYRLLQGQYCEIKFGIARGEIPTKFQTIRRLFNDEQASMSAIKYEYNKNDSFAVALQKVLRELRCTHNVQIYNFHFSTTDSAVDAEFLVYASPHRQCNASNQAYMYSLPIFTGCADTGVYFRTSLACSSNTLCLLEPSSVKLQKVLGGKIHAINDLEDRQAFIDNISETIIGEPDEVMHLFTDVRIKLLDIMASASPADLKDKVLVVVSVPAEHANGSTKNLGFWCICAAQASETVYHIVRESLNGTLALAIVQNGFLRPIAYLVLTDQLCGTYLVEIDRDGLFKREMRQALRSDVGSSYPIARQFQARFKLEKCDRSE